MSYLRSSLYLIGQIVSAVVVGTLVLPSVFVPSVPRAKIIGIWARFNIWTLKWICGVTYRVRGQEHIPGRPSIIISNHQSAWETLCFQLIFPAQSYILKRELLWIPFFGWGLALNRPIAIDRSEKRKALGDLVKQGKERLQEGRWLVVFPEGTRMEPGKPGAFQVGGAMIASKTAAPVVPVAHNAGLFWSKNGLLKYPGVVEVMIGKPIETKGKEPREINASVESAIKGMLETLPASRKGRR